MQSPALATAPHAAFRVLAILLAGKSKERNGTLMCSDSYAVRFGLSSHDTLTRSLELLEDRGLITITRKVQRMRRFPALYGVTWWPIHYREGQPLQTPEPATHAYRNFTPTIGAKHKAAPEIPSPRPAGDITPLSGANGASHHPDLTSFRASDHPDQRGYSKNLGGSGRGRGRIHARKHSDPDLARRIGKLIGLQPHLTDHDVARLFGIESARVSAVRESLTTEAMK